MGLPWPFLAYASCLEDNAAKTGDAKLSALATTLDKANESFLEANKDPSRRDKEINNRGSHFFLALYWAQELAKCERRPWGRSLRRSRRSYLGQRGHHHAGAYHMPRACC